MTDATLTPAIELLEAARESGISPGQLRKLIELASQNCSGEAMTAYLQSPIFSLSLKAAEAGTIADVDLPILRHILGLSLEEHADTPVFVIEVNYDEITKPARKGEQSGFEKLVAAGNYDWRNLDLNEKKFPIRGKGVKRFECRYLDADCSSDEGDTRIKDAGWKPAEIEHTLAFGAKYKGEQKKHPIVGLGSSAQVYGNRRVPCLFRIGGKRDLNLFWWDNGWPVVWRLLAVREIFGT